MSSIAVRSSSPRSVSPARRRSRMWRRISPIASAIPFRYGAGSTPTSSGTGISSPATNAAVIRASAYSFCASWRYPAKRTSWCSSTAASPQSRAARASPISSEAFSASPRWTARIAFADERIAEREAISACSRAAVFSSKRRWNSRVRSSRLTRAGPSGARDVELARGPHDHVHAIALVERAEPVVSRARGATLALRDVAASARVSARARVPRVLRRRRHLVNRVVHRTVARILDVLEGEQQEHVRDQESGEQRRDRPDRPQRRNRSDQERDADALEEEDEHAAAALTRAGNPALVQSEEGRGLLRRDDPAPPWRISFRKHFHVALEPLDARSWGMPSSSCGKHEGHPQDAQGRHEKPTHSPCPPVPPTCSSGHIWAGNRGYHPTSWASNTRHGIPWPWVGYGLALGGPSRSVVGAALAAPLLPEAEIRDRSRAVERLGRVVQGQGGDGGARERLHLDACPVSGSDGRAHDDPPRGGVGLDRELGSRHRDRMAERKELGRPLDAEDARDASRLDRLSLLGALDEVRDRLGGRVEGALGDGEPVRDLLAADLDDPCRLLLCRIRHAANGHSGGRKSITR